MRQIPLLQTSLDCNWEAAEHETAQGGCVVSGVIQNPSGHVPVSSALGDSWQEGWTK